MVGVCGWMDGGTGRWHCWICRCATVCIKRVGDDDEGKGIYVRSSSMKS